MGLYKVIAGIVVGVAVFLVCILVGALLGDVNISFVATIAKFLRDWATVIGLIAGLWYVFAGGFRLPPRAP